MAELQWTWIATLPMLSGALLTALAILLRSYRHEALGRTFLLFLLSTSFWSWNYMLELCSQRMGMALFWANVEYLAIPTTPVAFFLFATVLTGGSIRSPRLRLGLAFGCVVIWIAAWTDGYSHLLRVDPKFLALGAYRVVDFRPGPAYIANIAFCYILLAVAILRLIRMAKRSDSLSRKHAQIILLGLTLPVVGNLLRVLGYEAIRGIDQTPLLFALAASVAAYGIFRWSLISVAPIARDKVVDRMADAVIVIDPRGRVVDSNPAASRLFGLTSEELSRATMDDLTKELPDDAGGEATETAFDLAERSYILRRTPLATAANAPIGTLLQFTDVTEQRRNEDALRQAKEVAEEASASKSRFVAHVSHELRTPLNGVIGLAQLLDETWLDNNQRGYLTGIRQCSETLLGLVNDVLDLSRMEAEAMPMANEPIDIAKLVEEVAAIHRHSAERKGLKLTTSVRGLPAFLSGDPLRLRQILNNLIGNSVKFTEEGSVSVEVSRAGDMFELKVADTGIGIAFEQQERVLEPFQQADESTTRRFGGTGLGLPITRSLIKRMGGSLSLASRPGEGTTLVALLPLIEAESPYVEEEDDDIPEGMRVLVAEDNEVNALVITSLLEGLGCVVEVREDGQAALDAYGAGEFDIVFLDIQMPILDGLQVARAIRDRWPHRRTPIYALTANVLDEERQNAKKAGMDGFLTKPIRMAELSAALVKSGVA